MIQGWFSFRVINRFDKSYMRWETFFSIINSNGNFCATILWLLIDTFIMGWLIFLRNNRFPSGRYTVKRVFLFKLCIVCCKLRSKLILCYLLAVVATFYHNWTYSFSSLLYFICVDCKFVLLLFVSRWIYWVVLPLWTLNLKYNLIRSYNLRKLFIWLSLVQSVEIYQSIQWNLSKT